MTAALALALISAAASVASIAVSHITLGPAFALLLFARAKLRLPPFWPATAFFLLWTLAAIAASESPAAGRSQIVKFYVFLTLATLSTVLNLRRARGLLMAIAALGTASALWSFVEFWQRWSRARASGQPFYQSYVADRITGFKSHWMTFGGEMMVVLAIAGALLLFSRERHRKWWLAAGAIVALALALSWVRSAWFGGAAAAVYLLWFWKRWTVAALPVAIAFGVWLAPPEIQQRVTSLWKPDKKLDSNSHRRALWATGVRMIAANPLLGVGPEHVQREFERYAPAEYKPIPSHWYYGHLHNIYLEYAAERGLPALLAFLAMTAWALRDFARAVARSDPSERTRRFILHAAMASVIAILVGGIGEHNLGDSEVLGLFFTMLCCGYAAVNEKEPADVQPA